MAVTYAAISNLAYAARAGTTSVVTKPTVSNGQLMLALFVNAVAGNATSSATALATVTSTGWTEYTTTVFTTIDVSGFYIRPRLFRRIVDGSEGASFTFNHTSGNSTAIAIVALSGADTTTPISSVAQNNGTGTTWTYATITPTATGGLVAWGIDFADTANNLVAPTGTPTLTERLDAVVHYVSTADNVAGSATGTRTQTNNNATGTAPWWTAQIAVAPASAVAGIANKKLLIEKQALVRAAYW